MGPLPYSVAQKKALRRTLSQPASIGYVPMNSLPIIDDLSGFAPKAILIGEGQPADRVWSREEFVLLCNLMRNDNPRQ